MPKQLDLFGTPEPEGRPTGQAPEPEMDFTAERALAAELPPHVRFGTSSWTFPGWSMVYPPGVGEADLKRRGLELYSKYPLFGTVGIDRSYYAPLDEITLARYAAELPTGFRCVMKVFNEITNAVHPVTRDPNPNWFSVERFNELVLGPVERAFADHMGPFVFELMPLRKYELPKPREFEARLASFFDALPKGFDYAVELRNRELLTPEYLDVLRERGVGHVISFWERMPDVGEQLDLPGVLTAPFVVSRLLIPPGQRYDDRKRDLSPFQSIQDIQPKMRDDVVRLSEACEARGLVLLVIVNNKAEGSSPLTIRALAERIIEARRRRSRSTT